MRDVRRIDRVLDKLRAIWGENPDQRLGQLYANLVGHHRDVFYIEDDELEKAVDTLLETGRWGFPPECT